MTAIRKSGVQDLATKEIIPLAILKNECTPNSQLRWRALKAAVKHLRTPFQNSQQWQHACQSKISALSQLLHFTRVSNHKKLILISAYHKKELNDCL